MVTGDIKNQVDAIWNAFWTGGISNPLEVIEQITYLLFLKRLDDLHTLEENKANRLKKPMQRRIFPEGKDERGRDYSDLRWSSFKHFEPKEMFDVVDQHAFPFLRTLGGEESTYSKHMDGARFTIPKPALLAKVVDMIDKVPMEDRDTKGDIYEYMLAQIATAGQNGQFRTPRHIIQLMVELTAPRPEDVICDPACGTAGFLVAPGEYLREHHPKVLTDKKLRDYESCAKSLQKVVKTKKTELLFVALILRLLKPGGRAAIIVPAGILESDSKAHDSIRKQLVNNNRLEAVIALPHWVFKTYASVATAILVIGSRGQTEDVLFYRMENDGFYDDAGKTKREGSEIPEIKSLFECFRDDDYEPKKRKHRVVTRAEILENEFDLCERVYLSGYEYPEGVPLRPLSDLFEIEKGKSGASKAVDDGKFPFVTSAE